MFLFNKPAPKLIKLTLQHGVEVGCVGFAFSISLPLIGLGQWKSFPAQVIEGTQRTALIVVSVVAD